MMNSKSDLRAIDGALEKPNEATISSGLVLAAQAYMRHCIMDAVAAHKYGRKGYECYDIDPEIIKRIDSLDVLQFEELIANHARTVLSRSSSLSHVDFNLNSMLNSILMHQSDKQIADDFLRAGASNELMKKYFGFSSKGCSSRRSSLGIDKKPGRKTEPKCSRIFHEIYDTYEASMKSLGCHKRSLLEVHRLTGHRVDFVQRIVTSNNEFDL